jgi:molecular chaperone DnaK (HSP70)
MTRPHRVVAAIDFGTHGTGFAWAPVSQENSELRDRRISFYESWPEQKVSYPKNRSAVLLDADGNLLAWGWAALSMMDTMPKGANWRLQTGFKMSLRDTSAVTSAGAADAGGREGVLLAANAADAYDLTVLCLKQVVAVARDQIMRSAYEEDDIRWCLTVPAMWDQYTRDTMFRAAVAAGLPGDPERLLLAQEPAAAALYCAAKGENLISTPGSRFMVIDAGGGTIDITSYQVADDGRLNELAPAAGAFTGADFINRAFMEEVLGGEFGHTTLQRILSERRGAIAGTMDAWERAKRSFAPDMLNDLVIPLSAPFYRALVTEQLAGEWRGADEPPTEVVVSAKMVAGLFDRSIDETLGHVERHLREMRALSGISGSEHALLVGGFAESRYLRARFKEHLATRGVGVIVPEQPSVAVLAGAVHFAYDPSVFLSWRAPFTLGIGAAMPFEPGVDPEGSKTHNHANADFCLGRFDIFVTNRQALVADKPVTRRYQPVYENQTSITLTFVATDHRKPRYVSDSGVTEVASLTVGLSASMHLPAASRSIEVAMYFGQTHVRAEARNVATNEPQSVEIKWRPTW